MRKIAVLFTALLLCSAVSVFAQTTIKGKIMDAKDGTPVAGATIKVRGERTSVTSKPDGTFEIVVKSSNTLDITEIGHVSQTIKYSGSGVLEILLTQDTKALSEVVVTGVGVATSKRRLGIAVESVSADKLPQAPTASIDQALIGKIPGAQISTISGNPGDPVNIVLRGINSLGGTKPLILVDGVQVSGVDLNSLDLNNIERVEVVQGAASSTIYGAQGANGVIQIFTKKGKKGATRIDISSGYSSNEFLNVGHVQKSKLHPYKTDAGGNILDDATGLPVVLNNDGTLPTISYDFGRNEDGTGTGATRMAILGPKNINDQAYTGNLKFYDHFKQIFQTGYTLNNSVSVSGGGDKSDFNFTVANNINQTPILKTGKLNRTNLSINLGTELFKGLKLRSITQVIYSKNDITPLLGGAGGPGYGYGDQTSTLAGPSANGVYGFLNTSPFFDLTYKQADGNTTNYLNAGYLSVNTSNPYYFKQYATSDDNKVEIVQSLNLNYQMNKWVELDAKYGLSYRNESTKWIIGNQSENIATVNNATQLAYNAPDEKGEIDNFQYTNTYQNLLTSATFRFDLERDLHINFPLKSSTLVAYDYRKNSYKEYDTYGVGLPLNPPINTLSAGSVSVQNDYYEPFTTYGYLIDQKFELGDWGGIAGGFRTDWSSNFGDGLSFTFPHGNAYVAFSGFNFWKDSKISNAISYFKIRAAYGEAGIQPTFGARYPGIDPNNIGSSLAYSIQTNARNPLIEVERTKELEIGTDFTINSGAGKWFSVFNGSFSYWKRSSRSVIYAVSIAPSSGVTSQSNNLVDLSSNGIQAQLNTTVYKSKTFGWDFTVNFSKAKSVIDDVKGELAAFTAAAGSTQLKVIPGQPIGQIFGYKALTNINQMRADGKTPFIAPDQQSNYTIAEGRVVDKRTKAIYFSDEAGFIGDPNPKFNMSFINAFTYKDFLTIGFQFDWIYGSHLYNQTKEWMYRDGIHGDFDKPVTIDGVTAAYTAYHGSAYYGLGDAPNGPGNNATKDYFYESASFLRLRNVSLGFDIAKVMKLGTFKKLQLVFTGRNIWTKTKYTGFDPEINTGPANSSFERGIDHSSLPNIKSYQVSLNIGF
jgi:TonB-dependent starch-binding outer membrane protein SusC